MNNTFLRAGKLVTTHGVHGELKLLPDTDGPEFLLPFRTLYLENNTPLAVKRSRVQKNCLLLQLDGIDTVEQAVPLVGKLLFFRRDDPAIPAGTVFFDDLVGLPVFCEGVEIGTLTEVLPMPGSDVWVVKGEKEYMIPSVPAFVDPVDLSAGRVNVHLIEGMDGES